MKCAEVIKILLTGIEIKWLKILRTLIGEVRINKAHEFSDLAEGLLEWRRKAVHRLGAVSTGGAENFKAFPQLFRCNHRCAGIYVTHIVKPNPTLFIFRKHLQMDRLCGSKVIGCLRAA